MTVLENVLKTISNSINSKKIIYLLTEDRNLIKNIFDSPKSNICFKLKHQTDSGWENVNSFSKAFTCKRGSIINIGNINEIDKKNIQKFDDFFKRHNSNIMQYYFIKDMHLIEPEEKHEIKDNLISSFVEFYEEKQGVLIISSPVYYIPKGFEAYVELIDVPLIGEAELEDIAWEYINITLDKNSIKIDRKDMKLDTYLYHLKGLNEKQMRYVLNKVMDLYGRISGIGMEANEKNKSIINEIEKSLLFYIKKEKEQMTKKNGTISFIDVKPETLNGFNGFKLWIEDLKKILANINLAKRNGVDFPKGVLFSGLPGSGKSSLAKYTANELSIPLIKFDMGSILGKYVGESEANLNNALKMAEAVSPCVVWIDEIEKQLGGLTEGDNGVGKRCMAKLLNWMQENDKMCFIFATANSVEKLPSELLRRGRFEKKFYTFLPLERECRSILKGIIQDKARENKEIFNSDFIKNIDKFTEWLMETIGYYNKANKKNKFFTGADIKGLINDALTWIFINSPHSYPIDSDTMMNAMKQVLVQTKTYGETDFENVIEYWLKLRKYSFLNASVTDTEKYKYMLFDFDDVKIGKEVKWNENLYSYHKNDYDLYMLEVLKEAITEKYK